MMHTLQRKTFNNKLKRENNIIIAIIKILYVFKNVVKDYWLN